LEKGNGNGSDLAYKGITKIDGLHSDGVQRDLAGTMWFSPEFRGYSSYIKDEVDRIQNARNDLLNA